MSNQVTIKALLSIILVAGALVSQPTAFSAVIVTTSTTAPSENLLFQSQNVGGTGGLAWQWTTSDPNNKRDLLQQFHYTSDFVIERISLFATGAYAIPVGETVDFSLTINTYSSATSSSPTSTIASYDGTLTRLGSGSRWWTFDIPDTQLSADTLYGFVLSFSENLSGSSITWQTFSGNTSFPDAGLAQIDYATGSPVATFLSSDLNFMVQGTAVPEPATVSLLIGCVALAMWRRG